MPSADGKSRLTDMADTETLLRLAELSTRQIAETVQATGMPENAEAGRKGGAIAGRARRELEAKTGRKVVTGENFLPPGKRNPQLVPGTADNGR
jgi:hypothetical protein